MANNAHGLEVQRRLKRSIINGLHGAWSAGAISGALIGAAALQLRIPIQLHLSIVGIVIVAGSLTAIPLTRLPTVDTDAAAGAMPSGTGGRARAHVGRLLVAACAVATIAIFLEDVGSTWGGVYVVTEAKASVVDAAIPFVALMGALTLSRFVSDAVVDRIGPVATIRYGAALAVVGLVLVVLVPQTWAVSAGLGLIGFGIAPMIPLAMDAADRAPGLAPGSGLAAASTVMRIGSLTTPLLIGALGELAGLRIALALALAAIVVVPVAVFFLAGPLRGPRPAPPAADTD